MPRPTKQQIDDEILEAAAHLFARHGFKETSVQRIADTVGYSKTGLLHRFPTKEALQTAVIDRCVEQIRDTGPDVAGLPAGPDRDRVVLTGLAHLAVAQPGMVALLLSSMLAEPESDIGHSCAVLGQVLAEAFGDELHSGTDRALRITGALGAVAVASLALCDQLGATPDAPARLAAIGYDALGH